MDDLWNAETLPRSSRRTAGRRAARWYAARSSCTRDLRYVVPGQDPAYASSSGTSHAFSTACLLILRRVAVRAALRAVASAPTHRLTLSAYLARGTCLPWGISVIACGIVHRPFWLNPRTLGACRRERR